jgi:hypothetical protein
MLQRLVVHGVLAIACGALMALFLCVGALFMRRRVRFVIVADGGSLGRLFRDVTHLLRCNVCALGHGVTPLRSRMRVCVQAASEDIC